MLLSLQKAVIGSPPRVRGTAIRRASIISKTRITPACAGNRYLLTQDFEDCQDHPRVCGEQQVWLWRTRYKRGSPPRVRGTVQAQLLNQTCDRITPACAGNRATARAISSMARDHPRVCGEQDLALIRCLHVLGSPPRVRGTENRSFRIIPPYRITPACAGNSWVMS